MFQSTVLAGVYGMWVDGVYGEGVFPTSVQPEKSVSIRLKVKKIEEQNLKTLEENVEQYHDDL